MPINSLDQRFSGVVAIAFRAVIALLAMLLTTPLSAQAVTTYVNGTDGAINANTTCANPLARNFVVSNVFTVADVDLGVFAEHTWRGDIRLTLQHPDGTRVQLVDGDANNTSGDNFNVRLNDGATQVVNTDTATAAHSTANPPPFANNFRPNSLLSAFNGKTSNGTWRLEICDIFTGSDDGTFRHAELYLTAQPTNFADLSLTKTVNNSAPAFGANVIYTLTLSNSAASNQTATAQVTDLLPAGVTYVSHSGSGTYNPATGVWAPASIAPNQNRTLTITATVNVGSGTPITNIAEVTSSNRTDSDSTPGNGVASEDDYAFATFTVAGTRVAGIPPTLVCPNGTVIFDWTGRSWPQGSIANNYTLTGLGAFNWSISSPAGFMDIPALGGQHPVLTTAAQNQTTLSKAIDFNNRTEFATTTITLGEVVDGAQLTIFDVDFGANDFADRIKVYGTRGASTVIPILTNGTANYVIGNEAFGDQPSDPASAAGNVTVTFNQPVDKIFVEYGNYSAAPANPDGQAIQMKGAISVCTPEADLVVLKSSVILQDPINGTTNPKAIPGATIRYCILISNVGTSSARNVVASDILPGDVTYVAGSILSGTGCAGAATPEDDNAAGVDETDPAGANFASGTVAFTIGEVANGGSAAVTFRATID